MGGGGGFIQSVANVATAVVAPVLAPFEIAKTVAPDETNKAISAVSNIPLVGNAAKAGSAGSDILGDYATGNSAKGQKDIQAVITNSIPLLAAAAAPAVANYVNDNLGTSLTPSDLQFPGSSTPTPAKKGSVPVQTSGGGGGGAPRLPNGEEIDLTIPLLVGGGLFLLMKKG